MPAAVIASKQRQLPVTAAYVTRLDTRWVHGRDRDPDLSDLSAKKAILFGAGSLGSGVASHLAKAGVGELLIVDPGTLEPENVSRHELGIDAIGQNKASAMAEHLRRRFPHLLIEASGQEALSFTRENAQRVRDADLIVCATADWRSESALSHWARTQRAGAPTLFAWLEPHAIAGHAVLTSNSGACFVCLFDELGLPRLPVTRWASRTSIDVPACGGSFQPYGSINLARAQAMVAEQAINSLLRRAQVPSHHVCLAPQSDIQRAEGQWNEAWFNAHRVPVQGGATYQVELVSPTRCWAHQD